MSMNPDRIPAIPFFRPWEELETFHRSSNPQREGGIFRTNLPGDREPERSVTFAEVIQGERFHVWSVGKNNAPRALELMWRLHGCHRLILSLEEKEIARIVQDLDVLDIRKPSQ